MCDVTRSRRGNTIVNTILSKNVVLKVPSLSVYSAPCSKEVTGCKRHKPQGIQSWAKEWSLGCVNPAS